MTSGSLAFGILHSYSAGMSTRSSSSTGELSTSKILAWARGLETFERMDFVYLLMHSLFPTELRFIHGIVDGLLKRDESLYASSVQQANDFVRLSQFYEGHHPQMVIANDGLRRQFILDLSGLHPLNFYCADIYFGVLQRAELGTWTFTRENQKVLRELILITTMAVRHAAFRFDNRIYLWSISRVLMHKLKELKIGQPKKNGAGKESLEHLDQLQAEKEKVKRAWKDTENVRECVQPIRVQVKTALPVAPEAGNTETHRDCETSWAKVVKRKPAVVNGMREREGKPGEPKEVIPVPEANHKPYLDACVRGISTLRSAEFKDITKCNGVPKRQLGKEEITEAEEEEEEASRQDTEDEVEARPAIPLEPEHVEQHNTLTTSGADRLPLPNGYCEPPPVGMKPVEPVVPLSSTQVNQAFPPLGPPLRHPVRHPLNAPVNYGTPRHKTLSVPSKMNESSATGNALFRSPAEYPGPASKKSVESAPPVLPARANSVEHCDMNHNSEPAQRLYEEKTGSCQNPGRRLASQRSAPSPADFPRLGQENSIPHTVGNAHSSNSRPNPTGPDQSGPVDNLAQSGRSPESFAHPDIQHPHEPWLMPHVQQPVARNINHAPGITGAFPRVYSISGPNGPRFTGPNAAFMGPLPISNNFQPPMFQKPVSCYNCGLGGHYGDMCPKKKPMDPNEAERYCSLQRDSKLYPEKARLSVRHPGPHS